jgi:hypothetical protein
MSTINMPPRVFTVELTIVALHILTLLDARLTIYDGDILKPQIMCSKQWSLASKLLILNNFHISI